MLLRLFLLFTVVPLLELILLIEIGGAIGVGPTIGLVLLTGAAGAWMARREGLLSWINVQREMAAGRFPGGELLHSLFILLAGVVLITPGVITDLVGMLLLVRPLRKRLIERMRGRFEAQLSQGGAAARPGFFVWTAGMGAPGRGSTGRGESEAPFIERAEDSAEAADPNQPRRPRVIEL